MNKTTHTLIACCFSVVCVFATGSTQAMPQVHIKFETDQATGQEWIHAKANYQARETQAYEAFNAIVDYPEYHHWIENTKVVEKMNDAYMEFVIDFDFPWPLGKQWSRVQIKKCDTVISWKQTEGSLNINRGKISITEYGGQAHVDYVAILDVGYPDAFTRAYKEQFVTEFLTAIYNRMNGDKSLPESAPAGSTEYLTSVSPL